MESKEQAVDKRDNKPSPSSTSGHNFVIVSDERNIKCFRWEISNFSNVDDPSIFTDYFLLGGLRFRFQLFPKGEASRNTWKKYLGLYLEMDYSDTAVLRYNPGSFICSEVVIVNHVDDSKSKREYIYHRYWYGSNTYGHKEVVSLDFLQGPQSEFLLNGADLHINCDVRILEDIWQLPIIPQDEQSDAESASTSGSTSASTSAGVITENDDGEYEGRFWWTINNYSLFAERFKNNGMLRSPPFKIGQALYSIHLECQRNHSSTEGDKEYLSLFLNREDAERDKSPFCILAIATWNWNTDTEVKMTRAYGRLGVENMGGVGYLVGWLKLMDMLEFENPDNGHILDNDKVRFLFHFYALREKDAFRFNLLNAEARWNFRKRQGPVLPTWEQMGVENIMTTYRWDIKNYSLMVELVKKYKIKHAIIRSRPINIGQHETRMVLFPFGMPEHPYHVGLCIENLNAENETSCLVHCMMVMRNHIVPNDSRVKGNLLRFDKNIKFCGIHNFLFRISEFYGELGRQFMIDGRILVAAVFRLVEEDLLEEELSPLAGDRQRKRITWEVENFLEWKEVAGLRIHSRFFTVEGCRLWIVVTVPANDGRVIAGLRRDPTCEQTGDRCTLIYRLAVMNNRNEIPQWKEGINVKGKNGTVVLGKASDFVNDKIVFSCEIDACLLLKHESSDEDTLET